ncbi:MAG: DUF927 domain-containing protein [Chromatiales bacterium]|nr:DUF927 domain-containing protein [Chromatiales bacterium]
MEPREMTTPIAGITRESLRRSAPKANGWHEAGFVIGSRQIGAGGVQPLRGSVAGPGWEPAGSLEGWLDASGVLAEPGCEAHALVLLAGFGAPLLHLCGWQAAVLSLAGVSGAGKTLAARAALSIYADPNVLARQASSGDMLDESDFAAVRHLPLLLDETTGIRPERLAAFVYVATNGHGHGSRGALPPWQTIALLTSNRPLLDNRIAVVAEAHRRRVIELYFPAAMSAEAGERLAQVQHHFGHAGETYLREVCARRAELAEVLRAARETVQLQFRLPDAQRFALWTLAAALVGGEIARALKLHQIDVAATIALAGEKLRQDAAVTLPAPVLAGRLIHDWLAENDYRIARWAARTPATEADYLPSKPVGRNFGRIIAVRCRSITNMLKEHGLGPQALHEWLGRSGTESARRKLIIAPNQRQEWVYCIDAEKLSDAFTR